MFPCTFDSPIHNRWTTLFSYVRGMLWRSLFGGGDAAFLTGQPLTAAGKALGTAIPQEV